MRRNVGDYSILEMLVHVRLSKIQRMELIVIVATIKAYALCIRTTHYHFNLQICDDMFDHGMKLTNQN